ncbi:hypothetical protein B6U74_04950 [Candidatus Bathyarchaeota archaeon ex4484_205]|nr:MAG: hypothetical protein B6U74_04950 [Candidatus Bathyarchaeota archaeon ex4484_205]
MIIDIHTHASVHPYGVSKWGNRKRLTPEQLLEIMDFWGIDKAVVLPIVSPEGAFEIERMDEALLVAERCPDRLIPFVNVDARMFENSPATDFTKVLEEYKERGCKGLGEVTSKLYVDDPRVMKLYEACGNLDLPIIIHFTSPRGKYGLVDEIHLPRLERMLQKYPNTPFLGHAPAFWCEVDKYVTEEDRNKYPEGKIKEPGRVPELLEKYPNLYGDLSAESGYNAVNRDWEFAAWFLDKFQDKLLFGTDYGLTDLDLRHVELYNRFLEEGIINDRIYDKIMWQNATKLLRL